MSVHTLLDLRLDTREGDRMGDDVVIPRRCLRVDRLLEDVASFIPVKTHPKPHPADLPERAAQERGETLKRQDSRARPSRKRIKKSDTSVKRKKKKLPVRKRKLKEMH